MNGYVVGGVVAVLLSGTAAPTLTHTTTHRAATAAVTATPRRPAPTLSATWATGPQVRTGKKIVANGTTSAATGVIRIDRRVGTTWKPAATTTVTTSRRWSVAVTAPTVKSTQTYRAVWTAGTTKVTRTLPAVDVYRLLTYTLGTRGKITSDPETFAAHAATTYADPRGWSRAHLRFQRVRRGGDFVLMYAQAKTLPSFSSTCSAQYSCRVGKYVIINETPWLKKTPYFTGNLDAYRHMVVDHETGHWLGFSHAYCAGKNRPAPVMQQQSKGMQGCRANPWPLTTEIAKVR